MAKLVEQQRPWDKESLSLDKMSIKPFFDKVFGRDGNAGQVKMILEQFS